MPYKDPQKKREYAKKWREANPQYSSEYMAEYRKKHPDYQRKWDQAHRELRRKYIAKAMPKYLADPVKRLRRAARDKTTYAIRRGKLIRPDSCSGCKEIIFVEAHHPDHSRPLEVVWLCKNCHEKEVHA